MCVHPEKSSKILTFNLHLVAQVLALIRTAAVLQGNVPGYSARHSSPHRHWFRMFRLKWHCHGPWSSTRSMQCIFSQPRSAPTEPQTSTTSKSTDVLRTDSVFRPMFLENPGDWLWLVPEPRGPMWFVLCAAFPCSPSAHEESRQKFSCDPIWSNMIQYDAIWCMICMMQCMMQWYLTFWSNLLAAGSWKLDRKQDLTLEDEELVCRRGVWDPCWLWRRPQAEFPGISCTCTCFFVISSEKLWFHVMSIHFQDSRW
jgi:hypothetical protein